MKSPITKTLLFLLLTLVFFETSAQPWLGSGDIYYNGGNVGIGTDDPQGTLHIATNSLSSISPAYWADDLVVENTTHVGITLFNPSDKVGHILFGNPSNDDAARIHYQHNTHKMQFATLGQFAVTIDGNQNVGIGTATPDSKLSVNGTIHTKEVKVDLDGWSDHVFRQDYPLMDLKEVSTYIAKNQHLPNIPTETEVKENGINLGEMNAKLLEKIEELTLYQIQLLELIQDQQQRIKKLENQLN